MARASGLATPNNVVPLTVAETPDDIPRPIPLVFPRPALSVDTIATIDQNVAHRKDVRAIEAASVDDNYTLLDSRIGDALIAASSLFLAWTSVAFLWSIWSALTTLIWTLLWCAIWWVIILLVCRCKCPRLHTVLGRGTLHRTFWHNGQPTDKYAWMSHLSTGFTTLQARTKLVYARLRMVAQLLGIGRQ
jgi:hypothetical protein